MQVQFSDRSFQYGDGVFSTIRICDFQPQLWSLHWQRLANSLHRLGFAEVAETSVLQRVQANISKPSQVIKILISRGEGARGYGTQGIDSPQLYCWNADMPDYEKVRSQGVRLGVAEMTFAQQPLLAGIKHCSRLETVLLRREAELSPFEDLLVADVAGYLIEASAANVLVWHQQQWCTPELKQAGVAGVMREFLLMQGLIKEAQIPVSTIKNVESIALCNALSGIVPVHSIEHRLLDLTPALQLQRQLDQLLQEH